MFCKMLYVCLLLIFIGVVATNNFKEYLEPKQLCNVGDVVQNECNKCECKFKNIYACSSVGCTKNGTEEFNENNQIQELKCHPNMTYTLNNTICICNKDGFWPHKLCSKIFKSLPANKSTVLKCKPNSYVIQDCNVCRCGDSGEVDKDRCTKNVCTKKTELKGRRFSKSDTLYGACEAKSWYAIAPCQLCFCVNENKLICNKGNDNPKKLNLGTYFLSNCGKELLREAMELIPAQQNVLRYVKRNEYNSKLTKQDLKFDKNQEKEINLDANERPRENNKNPNIQDKDEYNSEEHEDSEEIVTLKTVGRQRSSTRLPYEEDDQDAYRNEAESDENSDKEIGVTIEQPDPKSTEDKADSEMESETTKDSLKSLGYSLSAQLPLVLSKVFKMALRKSMVSLNSDSDCEPGSTTMLKCNMCFCMKNHKLLCTKNVCN